MSFTHGWAHGPPSEGGIPEKGPAMRCCPSVRPATSRSWRRIPVSGRLIAWAVRARDLDRIVRRARSSGVGLGEAIEGSRRRADGVLLTWRFTDPHAVVAEGLVPFLIDWGGSPHPAASAPGGVSLLALRGEHPDPAGVARMLDVLGADLPIARAPRPALVASLQTRSGRVELR
jgi:hypothetical protein